ncbi:hypothetical protein WME89_26260 [Sorangium sp. So ce321]|uniref:hypothetical protein n=1 Tax=Sorangium sp. So ce321 TaxID=3133300 RepID=UPI003F5FC08B
MKKTIGYASALLILAGACGMFFGSAQAEASDTWPSSSTYSGGHDHDGDDEKCDELCECIKDVLKTIKHADRNPSGKIKHPDDVLDKVKDDLKECKKKFCRDDGHDDESCD